MTWKNVVTAAYLCNLLLGNVCLLQVANAAEQDGPVVRMSMNDPAKCPWIDANAGREDLPARESPCATGHCFSQPEPHDSNLTLALQEIPSQGIIPPSPVETVIINRTEAPPSARAHGPPLPVDIGTIVLRT